MASAQSKIFNILLRLINKKSFLKRQMVRGRFSSFTSPTPSDKILKSCHVNQFQIKGRNVFTLQPKQGQSKKHILYLHGGAYIINFVRLHWTFLNDLIEKTGCTITAPDYPLAPAHNYKEVFDMMGELYPELLHKVHPENLIIMGDSAGGGLALALAQKIKFENLPQPKHIILLSPWLDITLSNPEIAFIDPLDPFTGVEGLRLAGQAYVGNDDPTSHLVSPIYGPLDGLGEISVFIGTKEILVADARKFKAMMESKGVSINYYEYDDMIHVWMLLHFPESRKARNEITKLIMSA